MGGGGSIGLVAFSVFASPSSLFLFVFLDFENRLPIFTSSSVLCVLKSNRIGNIGTDLSATGGSRIV